MLAIDIVLPVGIYLAILVAGMKSQSKIKWRVILGASLCLFGFVASALVRIALTRYLPAAQFATYVPLLNLGRTIVMMSGIVLIGSAAITNISSQDRAYGREEPDDNPYQYRE